MLKRSEHLILGICMVFIVIYWLLFELFWVSITYSFKSFFKTSSVLLSRFEYSKLDK